MLFLNSNSYHKLFFHKFIFFLSLIFIIVSCAPSKRFTEYKESIKDYKSEIRVLLADSMNELIIGTEVYLTSDDGKKLAIVKANNQLKVESIYENLLIQLGSKNINGKIFYFESVNDSLIIVNNRKYRGRIKVINVDGSVKLINQISLEDYIKGVMTKEMPVGKGDENYEALKAFAIAARTYAINKIFNSRTYFDIYTDIRDQVYGGADSEHPLSNKAVDETKNMILTYNDEPAIIFYHSTCGGYTESSVNIFTKEDVPYLQSIKDGNPAYCSISPNFVWKENISEKEFIKRLAGSRLIKNSNWSIEKLNIKSRFPSGRINELEIIVKNNDGLNSVSIFGNQIRTIIKNQSGTGLLRSNNFMIALDSNRNIEITGKGSGHGVGLCQWGAIGQSKSGKNYREILSHYFPGTEIKKLND